MKIVHVVLSNGADYTDNWGYQENTLPEEQVRLGHEVTVITSTYSSLVGAERERIEGHYEINGVKIVRIKPAIAFLKNRIAFFPDLYNVLSDEKPQLVFLHGFLMPSLSKVKKYKQNNTNVVVFFDAHNTYVNSLKRHPLVNKYILHRGLWRFIYQKNKDVFSKGYFTAFSVKSFIQDMYDVDKHILTFLPMGVYIPRDKFEKRLSIRKECRKKLGIPNSVKVLVAGGRLREDKRIREIVEAISLIKNDDLKLLIFGNFQNATYEKQVKEIADDRIIFVGWQDNQSMQELFFASDVALFTGTQSVVWRTAVGCGLPAICRYSDGAEELDVGGNCIFLHSDDSRDWARTIEELVDDEDRLAGMREIAETKGAEFYSEERIAQSIIDDYNSFSSNK